MWLIELIVGERHPLENVIEGYYSIALTPAIRTSFHVQTIDSANPAIDDPVVLSARLQLDF